MTQIRTRFAPSPTGGLHLGGVRTALFSYLYAKKYNGDFILRIEDTDQTRFVEGAEEYIIETLKWCKIPANEGVGFGNGPCQPYRQSERKQIYQQYAEQLIKQGNAYYAFDTPQDIENQRQTTPNWQYDLHTRLQMCNSLTLPPEEVTRRLQQNERHVIRIKLEPNQIIEINDLIRGKVEFNTNILDDKVLIKADGLPTYHLAVVVDDHTMQISHAFRGEEWLASAPIHILLYQYFNWTAPQFAHLPLILKPDGKGKLSKRDGDRLGFPVYARSWTPSPTPDTPQPQTTIGFREKGFLPEAFLNTLVNLGWNSGTENEIFDLSQLIQLFDIQKVHKANAKFDFEKAKWFNQQHIKLKKPQQLLQLATEIIPQNDFPYQHLLQLDSTVLLPAIELIKDRITLLPDMWVELNTILIPPAQYDPAALAQKWQPARKPIFENLITQFQNLEENPYFEPNTTHLEDFVKNFANQNNLKIGEILPILRLMLMGTLKGAGVYQVVHLIGKQETIKRMNLFLEKNNANA